MNILLANDGSLDHGGICVFMLQWVRGIKKADNKSNVFVYFRDSIIDSEMEEYFKQQETHIYQGNISRAVKFSDRLARKKVVKDISSIIENKNIDVLHINSGVYGFTSDLLSIAQKKHVPMRIAHFHGSYPENHIEKIIHSFLRWRITSAITDYAGCSKEAATVFFGKENVSSSKWHFIPNAIETDRFRFNSENRKKFRGIIGVEDDSIVLGAVGRMTVGKNHIFLIDILAELKTKDIPVKLLILGDGMQRENLKTYAKQRGIEEDLLLPGAINDVSGWLSAFDFYMMPSLSEGLPISAIEAQANGLVCLLSDRITTETDLTGNVDYFSVDEGVDDWVKFIMLNKPIEAVRRKQGYLSVKQKGFDMEDTPKYVKDLYRMV